MTKTQNKNRFYIILLALFIVFTELYRRMTIAYKGLFGTYYSDIRMRLDMIAKGSSDETYSLFLIPELFICKTFGETIGAWFTGIYLSIFTVATIILVIFLLKKLCANAEMSMLMKAALACMVVVSIYVPFISERFFGPYTGSVWHNETYIGMRFCALLLLLFFYKTHNRYLEKFTIKEFIIELLLFTLVNCVKPNFTIAFAPSMLVMMIVDIIKAKGKGLVNWMLYGIPVLLGSVVFVFQFSLLFSNTESDDGSHIVFVLGDAVLNRQFPIITILLAYAFPIAVFVFHYREIIKSKFHLVCYLAWFFSFLEYAFLSESGERMMHGNFGWGLHFFTFLIFCLSVGFLVNDLCKNKEVKGKSNYDKNNVCEKRIFYTEAVLASLHLMCGLIHFTLVLLGGCAYVI